MTSNLVYSKDSFDRFGDDFCELILSYLTFKEQFCYECVSQQWLRLIHNKQQKLILYSNRKEFCENSIEIPRNEKRRLFIENLFKKFYCVKEIETRFRLNNEEINSIINNCLFVQKINFIGYINASLLIKFMQKFGQRLRSIDLSRIHNKRIDKILSFTPNLRHITIIGKSLNALNEVFLTNLRAITFYKDLDLDLLNTFSDKYRKQITKIEIIFTYLANEVIYDLNGALTIISRFENLEFFGLYCRSFEVKIVLPINYSLKIIANKCKKIKHLNIDLLLLRSMNENLFKVFGQFNAVEDMSLSLPFLRDRDLGRIEDLNDCLNLKYLNLNINTDNGKTFENINLYLPELRQFTLKSSSSLTDKTINDLSKLQNLSKLKLLSMDINFSAFINAFENKSKMKTIIIDCKNKMRDYSAIDELTKLALKNPKTKYDFIRFKSQNLDNYNSFPRNLLINKSKHHFL